MKIQGVAANGHSWMGERRGGSGYDTEWQIVHGEVTIPVNRQPTFQRWHIGGRDGGEGGSAGTVGVDAAESSEIIMMLVRAAGGSVSKVDPGRAICTSLM